MKNENITLIFNIFLFLLFFHIILSEDTYTITLKVKTEGEVLIINNTYLEQLSDIKVGDTSVTKDDLLYINDPTQVISLIWHEKINNCNYMFAFLSDITEIDLSLFDFSDVDEMSYMFYRCSSLKSIKFDDNIDTSNVNYLNYTFYGCYSLESVDISKFTLSNVQSMEGMFYRCYSLQSLNLAGKNIDANLKFTSTFQDCYNLKSLDLSDISANSSISFYCMFCNCYSLKSLDLSSFTKFSGNILTMATSMFENCTSLNYVKIPNFFTTKNNFMNSMFSGCTNLQYVNLNGLYEYHSFLEEYNFYDHIFDNNPRNMVICIPNDVSNLMPFLSNITCLVIDCNEDWQKKQKKINNETGDCMTR